MATPSAAMVNKVASTVSKPANVTTPPQATASKPVNTNTLSSSDIKSAMSNGSSAGTDIPAKSPDQVKMEACTKAINESEDLVEALEAVASVYACPATVLCNDDIDDIRVSGDVIVAPSVSPKGKENAIMRSISAVLDYISQRVDEKLNAFHKDTIEKGAIDEHIQNVSNPNKGKVISRHVDPDGNEVLVYDTGLVDMTASKNAKQFVAELRESGAIPQIKYTEPTRPGEKRPLQYFTAADDITNGVDMPATAASMDASAAQANTTQGGSNYGDSAAGASVNTPNENELGNVEETDIPAKISESADIINMISKYGNTRHLGYDMLTEQGFKNLKPVDFFEEADTNIPVTDVKHMKFDNTHIIKAIKYFNAARAEQPEAKGNVINMTTLVNSKNWDNGIKELEKQFDCHITLNFVNDFNSPKSTNASTKMIVEDYAYRQKCTVSKSKGFQLHGLPINIYVINQMFTRNAPSDPRLFGQSATSIILHEIFHNIMGVMRTYNVEFNSMLASTVVAVSVSKNAKTRRKLLSNFLAAGEKLGMIHMNSKQKKAYIKKMLIICAMNDNAKNRELAEKLADTGVDDSKLVDDLIARKQDKMENFKQDVRKEVNDRKMEIASIISFALFMSIGGAGMMTIKGALFGIGIVGMTLSAGAFLVGKANRMSKLKKFDKEYANLEKGMYRDQDLEEHWCDMFAAMYNLPITFFHNDDYKLTTNKMSSEQIKKIHELEVKWGNIMNDPHPSTIDRMRASVKCAQTTLDSGVKLDPCVKSYLEWIVANNSKLLEEDIDDLYSTPNFDPKSAENLDAHIQSLISKSGVQVTESFVYDVLTC